MKSLQILTLILACSVFGLTLEAADWTMFRGPDQSGVSAESNWKPFNGKPNIVWKKELGTGSTTVVVSKGKAITMGSKGDTEIVYCFDEATGKELWIHKYPCKFSKRSYEGGPGGTPTIDGEYVYVLSYLGDLFCLKLADGSVAWKKHVVKDFGGETPRWKYAGSPRVFGKMLIMDIGGKGSSTIALDKTSGAKVWGSGSEMAGYATPIFAKIGGKDVVYVFKGMEMVCLDPNNGKKFWSIPWKTSYNVNASTPSAIKNTVLISSGYKDGRGALFSNAGARPRQIWKNEEIKTKMSSCIVMNDLVFVVPSNGKNRGTLMCVGLKNGKTLWTSPKKFGQGTVTGAGDKVVVLGEQGNLAIAAAVPTGYKQLAEATVLSSRCWVTPVFANGRIYCRNNNGSLVVVNVGN